MSSTKEILWYTTSRDISTFTPKVSRITSEVSSQWLIARFSRKFPYEYHILCNHLADSEKINKAVMKFSVVHTNLWRRNFRNFSLLVPHARRSRWQHDSAVLIRRTVVEKVSVADKAMFGTKRFTSRHSGQSKLSFTPNRHVLMRKVYRPVLTAWQSCAADDSNVTWRHPDFPMPYQLAGIC